MVVNYIYFNKLQCRYKITVFLRKLTFTYNFRMAQVMQWPPAIRNYMRKVRLKYQHVNAAVKCMGKWHLHVDMETEPSEVLSGLLQNGYATKI